MPVATLQVSEYECIHCGWKWINRVNGKDRAFPKNCAKCKRKYWNGMDNVEQYGYSSNRDTMSDRERELRRRLFQYDGRHHSGSVTKQFRLNELCKTFLNLKPRPSIGELETALWPLGWNPREKYSLTFLYIEDDQRLLKEESAKRIEFMQQVIKSRQT